MISFKNKKIIKLYRNKGYSKQVRELLVAGEEVIDAYRSIRDGIVFTNKRMILVNVQGITGKKVDYTSIPYRKISVFSVETAGVLDLDAELEVFIQGLGKIAFEFVGFSNIKEISKHIAQHIL